MQVNNPRLIISAASSKQWPNTTLGEVLLCGRSNVGKSSFINALVRRKSLAYVGKTPGKTRLLNFYNIDDKLILVDAPGYGYQKDKRSDYQHFGSLMDEYILNRNNLKLCILLLDIRRDLSNDDQMMIEYFAHHHLPYLVILTKSDKLAYSKQLERSRKITTLLDKSAETIIMFKADNEEIVKDTWDKILNYI